MNDFYRAGRSALSSEEFIVRPLSPDAEFARQAKKGTVYFIYSEREAQKQAFEQGAHTFAKIGEQWIQYTKYNLSGKKSAGEKIAGVTLGHVPPLQLRIFDSWRHADFRRRNGLTSNVLRESLATGAPERVGTNSGQKPFGKPLG